MSMSFACISHSSDPLAAIAFSSWRVGGFVLRFGCSYVSCHGCLGRVGWRIVLNRLFAFASVVLLDLSDGAVSQVLSCGWFLSRFLNINVQKVEAVPSLRSSVLRWSCGRRALCRKDFLN